MLALHILAHYGWTVVKDVVAPYVWLFWAHAYLPLGALVADKVIRNVEWLAPVRRPYLWTLHMIERVGRTALTLRRNRALPWVLRHSYLLLFIVCNVIFFWCPIDDVLYLLPIAVTVRFYRSHLLDAWTMSGSL